MYRPGTSASANKNPQYTEQRRTTSNDYDTRTEVVSQANGATSASPAASDTNFQTADCRGTYMANNHLGMNSTPRPPTSVSQGSQSTFFPPHEANFWHEDWSNANFGPVSGMAKPVDQFDGVGDIFQLMDASYQLSEQMF